MVGSTLAALVVLGLVAIGLGGLVAPRSASAQYGIVLDDPRALGFIRAMAARDLVIGGLLGLLALEHARTTLGWGICLTAFIAAIDLLVVTADRRTTSDRRIDRARVLHASGVLGLLVAGAALLMGW
jgi:hypothetical protein